MRKILLTFKKIKYELLVFAIFVLVRLPSLGHEIFNTDVWKWKARIFNFGSGIFALDFAQTLQRYHPGVTLMWLGTIAVKINSFYYKILLGIVPPDNDIATVFTLHFIQKLVVVVFIGIVMCFIFYALSKIVNEKYALLYCILLSIEPFYLGLTRVIHLEGLLSTLMLASFLWGYLYIDGAADQKINRRLILSALFGALAILTKTSSLFLLAFIPFMFFLHLLNTSQSLLKSTKATILPSLKWFMLTLLLIVLFWPALWVAPVQVLTALHKGIFDTGVEEGHAQLYFGKFVQDPGFTFYFVVLFLRSSLYLIIGLLGFLLICRKISSKPLRKFFVYAFLFSALYMIAMTIPSKKLDRYLLPSIVGFLLLSSYFFIFLFEKFKGKYKKLLIPIFFLPGISTLFWIHPDYFSFYNPLFGGLKRGMYIIEPKWMIGSKELSLYFEKILQGTEYKKFEKGEAFDTLYAQKALENRLVVGYPEKYYTQIYPFMQEIGAWATIKDLTPHSHVTTFFVYPVWEDNSIEEDRFNLEYVDTIYIRGVPAYNVYLRIPYLP